MKRPLTYAVCRPKVAAILAIGSMIASTGSACEDGIGFRLPDPLVRVIAFGDSTTNGPASMQLCGRFLRGIAVMEPRAIIN